MQLVISLLRTYYKVHVFNLLWLKQRHCFDYERVKYF